MADDLQSAGTCSTGGSWWNNPARSASFDVPSSTIPDITGGNFSWSATDLIEAKARSCDESAGSASAGSSTTFQDPNKAQLSSLDLSSSSLDWTRSLLSGERSENSFQAMLQENLNHDPSIEQGQVHIGVDRSSTNPFKDMINQNFALLNQQHQLSSGNNHESGDFGTVSSYPFISASLGCSSATLQGLLGPETKPQQSIYDNPVIDYQFPATIYRDSSDSLLQPSWGKFSELLRSSPPKQQPSNNQLQFSNDAPYWHASSSSSSTCISEASSGYYSLSASQLFESKPVKGNLSAKDVVRDSCSSSSKKTSSESAIKRPRVETPSPLPIFKVRKEKLGDRITALQQLVSPFGKTDTASVLHEAIEYIKFLHDQVGVLSAPYLKTGHPMQHQQGLDEWKEGEGANPDLRSRGLCLVPVASKYPVASETTSDFWHPTFGGPFR